MATHANRVQMTVSGTPGTGTITLGSASSGYRSFASAYGADATVDVLIVDGTAWEVARGCTYTHSGTTLSRGTLESSSTGSAISLTSSAIVSVILPASTGNVIENFLGAWGALSGENSITGTATAVVGRLNVCSGTTADYTVTLPAVSGNAGKYIGFIMASGLTKLVTLDGNASETIDGATTRVMWASETALLYCDGSTWTKVAGKSRPMSCLMYLPSNQTVSAATMTLVNLTSTSTDNTGLMADTTNKRINIKRAGSYVVSGVCTFNSPGAMSRTISAGFQNGSQVVSAEMSSDSGTYPGPFFVSTFAMVAGDYMDLRGYQATGTAGFYGSSGLQTQLSATEVPSW